MACAVLSRHSEHRDMTATRWLSLSKWTDIASRNERATSLGQSAVIRNACSHHHRTWYQMFGRMPCVTTTSYRFHASRSISPVRSPESFHSHFVHTWNGLNDHHRIVYLSSVTSRRFVTGKESHLSCVFLFLEPSIFSMLFSLNFSCCPRFYPTEWILNNFPDKKIIKFLINLQTSEYHSSPFSFTNPIC